MIFAPLSTAQRMPSATCSRRGTDETPAERDRHGEHSASGATPSIPAPPARPREAAREATQLPCSTSPAPVGVRAVRVPRPDSSVPPTTPLNSGLVPIPVSMIAIRTPAPRVTPARRPRMPLASSQYSAAWGDVSAGGGEEGVGVAWPRGAARSSRGRAARLPRATRGSHGLRSRRARRRAHAQRSGSRPSARARHPPRIDSRPAASAWAARACRHLTRVGMPPAETPAISATSPKSDRSATYCSCAARTRPQHPRPPRSNRRVRA